MAKAQPCTHVRSIMHSRDRSPTVACMSNTLGSKVRVPLVDSSARFLQINGRRTVLVKASRQSLLANCL